MDVEQKDEITLSFGNVVLPKNGENKMVRNEDKLRSDLAKEK